MTVKKRIKIETGIFKHPNGTYEVEVATHLRGKYEYGGHQRGVKSLGQARNLKRSFKSKIEAKRYKIQTGAITWEEAVTEYVIKAKSTLATSTWSTQLQYLKNHISEFNSLLVTDITKQMIQQLIEKKLSDNKPATKQGVVKGVKAVFKLQVDKGVLPHNPAQGIIYWRRKMATHKNKIERMTRDEVITLLSEAKRADNPWFPIWYLAYHTGARTGELIALKWRDVYLDTGKILIQHSYCKKDKIEKCTKNGEARTVPVSKGVVSFLSELKLQTSSTGYVLPRIKAFLNGKGAAVLKDMQKQIGIREVNFHSIRASFVTDLLSANVPANKVQKLVGHMDAEMLAVYTRLHGSELVGATDAIEADLSDVDKIAEVVPINSIN